MTSAGPIRHARWARELPSNLVERLDRTGHQQSNALGGDDLHDGADYPAALPRKRSSWGSYATIIARDLGSSRIISKLGVCLRRCAC